LRSLKIAFSPSQAHSSATFNQVNRIQPVWGKISRFKVFQNKEQLQRAIVIFVFNLNEGSIMIKTGSPVISIYTEMTPNPETMKFVANKLLYPGKSIDFPDLENAKASPLATELFGFPFIKAVFIASNFVTLTKTVETDWNDVIPTIRQFLKEYLEENKVVINEEEIATIKQESSNTVAADDDDVVKRIKELLENYVKPAVEMDGGAIQFKSYNDGVVNLMLQGSCSGCPSSMITLKAGIEGMMKRMIPEVKEVVAEAE
jgi:Fe-S cluster biogenesis protein NfuA